MVFCNKDNKNEIYRNVNVTILILIDGFLQFRYVDEHPEFNLVTILILIDGFLQSMNLLNLLYVMERHNPYFNRWFSAI